MIVNNIDSLTVEIDGVIVPKIYRARAFGDVNIQIDSIFTDIEYNHPLAYTDITIDGSTYPTQLEAINELNKVLYSSTQVAAYGSLRSENLSAAVALTLQNTYYPLIFKSLGESKNTTLNLGASTITIEKAGNYLINFSVSHEGAAENYTYAPHKNGGLIAGISARIPNAANGIGNMGASFSDVIPLVENDVIDIRVRCYSAAGQTARGRDASFSLIKISD